MPATYLSFDFGTNEESAQKARHKLEGWKQAFRLDKRLLYKFDRGDAAGVETAATAPEEKPAGKGKSGSRSEEHTSELQSRSDLVCRLLLAKKKNKSFD